MWRDFTMSSNRSCFHLLLVLIFFGIALCDDDTQSGAIVEYVFSIPSLVDGYSAGLMITTNSVDTVNISVSFLGQNIYVGATRNTSTYVGLPADVLMEPLDVNPTKSIVVSSMVGVSVYVINRVDWSGDVMQVIPSAHLGTTYQVASYQPYLRYYSCACISALYPSTSVRISTPYGHVTNINLTQYESYRYDAEIGMDLTGAVITSNKPISVSSGSLSRIPSGRLHADVIMTQLLPTDAWGAVYHIFPFKSLNSGFVYRVFARDNNTTLQMSNGIVIHIAPGDFYEGDVMEDTIVSFVSDYDVMVAQYMKSYDASTPGRGDASMLIVPPVSSYTSNLSFPVFEYESPHDYYINVVTNCINIDGLLLDDATSVTSWERLTTDDQSMCCVRHDISTGYHTITHANADVTFYVTVYAIGVQGWASSYAYTATQFASEQNTPHPEVITTETTTYPISQAQSTPHPEIITNETTTYPISKVTFRWDETETVKYMQEDIGSIELNIKLKREGTAKEERVDIKLGPDGTAREGLDFRVHPKQVVFPVGDTKPKYVTIEVIDDSETEDLESFQLILGDPDSSDGNRGYPYEMTIYIQANDGYVKEQTGFVSQNITFECDITKSDTLQADWANYKNVTLYMQNDMSQNVKDANPLGEIFAEMPKIELDNNELSFTFELIDPEPIIKAKVTIYDLELSYSGYFWCVFRQPSEQSSFMAYEQTLMSISPCVEPTSELATSDNECVGLSDLNMVNVSVENVVEVAEALAQVTDRPDGIFTAPEIEAVGDVISNIVETANPSEEVTESVVATVSNLLGAEDTRVPPTDQFTNNTTSRIAESLETQVSLTLGVNDSVRIINSNIAVEGVKPAATGTITGIGFAITSDPKAPFRNDTTITISDDDYVADNHPPASIYLSSSTVADIKNKSKDSDKVGFLFLAYRNDFLFPSKKAIKNNLTVDGVIIAASVIGVNVTELEEPVHIETQAPQDEEIHNTDGDTEARKYKINRDYCHYPKPQCVFWDFDLNDWSPEGCRYLGLDNVTEYDIHQCECDHLTNFAVLAYHGKEHIKSQALDVISKLGCGLSVATLTLTVILFTVFKKLRRKARTITVHLCLSLIGLYLVFLIAVDWTCPKVVCTITAALLQYFVLTSMVWMTVEARFLYIKLVRVFDPEKAGFVTKAAIFAWGAPLIVVAISLGISLGVGSDDYLNENYCFPKRGLVLYLAVLLPIALAFLHNIITFGIIMKSIFRPRPGQKSGRSSSENKILIERCRHSITITCLLGLTWVLGFFAIAEATLVFQWLFCILNSFQGVFIFIFMCLTQDEVKNILFSSCRGDRRSSQSGSGFTSGTGGRSNTAGFHSTSDNSEFRSVAPNDYESGTINTNDGSFSNNGLEMNEPR